MNKSDKGCILFFVKYPEEGQVKTRLSAGLNEAVAAELYRNFVLDLLSMLEKLDFQFHIYLSPENSREKFIEWLGDQYSYVPQQGDDLGQRMKNALSQAFDQGFSRAIVIGSDMPDLPGELIDDAFLSLKTHDAVLGPTFDGGYYLIGFNSGTFLPEVFEEMEWSTDTVFANTISRLRNAGLRIHELPERRDIDVLADLKYLYLESGNNAFSRSRTMSYILNNSWLCTRLG